MPSFDFICSAGHTCTELAHPSVTTIKCPICGVPASKQFSPTRALRMAPWMRSENEDANARQRHVNSLPSTQKKIKEGVLVPDTGDKYGDSLDGPEGTSCVLG